MIKVSAIKPKARATATLEWRKELAYETQSKIRAWGLEVSWAYSIIRARISDSILSYLQFNKSMIKIKARTLDPPKVLYANNMDARAMDGSWRLGRNRVSRW